MIHPPIDWGPGGDGLDFDPSLGRIPASYLSFVSRHTRLYSVCMNTLASPSQSSALRIMHDEAGIRTPWRASQFESAPLALASPAEPYSVP